MMCPRAGAHARPYALLATIGLLCALGLLPAGLALTLTRGLTLTTSNMALFSPALAVRGATFAVVPPGAEVKLSLSSTNASVGAESTFALYRVAAAYEDFLAASCACAAGPDRRTQTPTPGSYVATNLTIKTTAGATYTMPADEKFGAVIVLVAGTAPCVAESFSAPGCYLAALPAFVAPADSVTFMRLAGLATVGSDAGQLRFTTPPSLLDLVAAASSGNVTAQQAAVLWSRAAVPFVTGSTYLLQSDAKNVGALSVALYKYNGETLGAALAGPRSGATSSATDPLAASRATVIVDNQPPLAVAAGSNNVSMTWTVVSALTSGLYMMVSTSKTPSAPAGDIAVAFVQQYRACTGDCRRLLGTWSAAGEDCKNTSESEGAFTMRFTSVGSAGVMVAFTYKDAPTLSCLVDSYSGTKMTYTCLGYGSDATKTITLCVNVLLAADNNTAGAAFTVPTVLDGVGQLTCLDSVPANFPTATRPACPADKSYGVGLMTRTSVSASVVLLADPKSLDTRKAAEDFKAKIGSTAAKLKVLWPAIALIGAQVEVASVTVLRSARRSRRSTLQVQQLLVEFIVTPQTGTTPSSILSTITTLASSGQLGSLGGASVSSVNTDRTLPLTTTTGGGSNTGGTGSNSAAAPLARSAPLVALALALAASLGLALV
eukprot:tig00021290_g19975.t1